MKLIFIIIILILFLLQEKVKGGGKKVDDDGGEETCDNLNDCANYPGSPFCIPIPSLNDTSFCRQCDPSEPFESRFCSCGLDEYCVSDPLDEEYGFCRRKEKEILGRSCTQALFGTGMQTKKGENDLMYCGKVNYDEEGNARFVEWQGSCQQRKCTSCSVGFFQTANTYLGSPMLQMSPCQDDRICLIDHYVIDPSGFSGWTTLKFQPSVIFFFAAGGCLILNGVFFFMTKFFEMKEKKLKEE